MFATLLTLDPQVFNILCCAVSIPFLWLAVWLFAGGIFAKGTTLRIGWPWCLIGLATMAIAVLLIMGQIQSV